MHRVASFSASALALVIALAACSDDDKDDAGSSGSSGDAGSSDAGARDTGTGSTTDIPTTPDALKAWLIAGNYRTWSKESAAHASEGPHASSVLTFINPALESSLAADAAEHPAGAAAVKEFLDASGVSGWAVGVKTQATSDDGQGWYWYETFNVDPKKHGIEGQGKSTCTGCHSNGEDFVLTAYPLR